MTTPLLQQALEALESLASQVRFNGGTLSYEEAAAITAIQAHLSTSQAVKDSLTTEQCRKLLESADMLNGDGHVMEAKDADWTALWLRRHVRAHGITKEQSNAS